jgi:hypothetical protein
MAAKREIKTKSAGVAPRPASRAGKTTARPKPSKAQPLAASKRPSKSALSPKSATSARPAGRRARPVAAKAEKPARAKPAPARRVARKPAAQLAAPRPVLGDSALSEEERIEAAKYLPRDLPKRLFEEERFLFPESYGITRIRLLIKDPEWLFVHWDVNPKTLDKIRGEMGERVLALTRLTLRIADPENGGQKTILLPPHARSWYARADAGRSRAYRAELGLTLPSGEFRSLAESNTVVTPRVGPSPELARGRGRLGPVPGPVATRGRAARGPGGADAAPAPAEPWQPNPERSDGVDSPGAVGDASSAAVPVTRDERGGASEAFRPGGASDKHRR